MKRIVAANRVVVGETEVFSPGVVEIEATHVGRVYALDGEQPFTEWLGGTIHVCKSVDGTLEAFWRGTQLTSL